MMSRSFPDPASHGVRREKNREKPKSSQCRTVLNSQFVWNIRT